MSLPSGASWINPYLRVSDVQIAADFYQQAFGFMVRELAAGPDGALCHGELTYQQQLLMIGNYGNDLTQASPKVLGVESPMSLYLYCECVDDFYKNAVQAGAISLEAPADTFWGDRMCRLQDPDGYTWAFATFSGQRT